MSRASAMKPEEALLAGLWLLEPGGTSYVRRKGFKLIYLAAQSGNALAQYNAALCFENGLGTRRNASAALQWYMSAARRGVPEAAYNAGVFFETGRACERSFKEAFRWYTRSARSGFADAQHNLAYMYLKGRGTKQNLRLARKWFERAAENGVTDSQFNLGLLYEESNTTAEKAVKWYEKAAASGDVAALCNLGAFLCFGPTKIRQTRRGITLLKKAANLGDKVAHRNLKRFEAQKNGHS
jgi:TPR repeat protein